ncbi:hypothetical protein BC351_30965 [Paenibacillus ferrarius]|uniref:SLH domain-containing protein n=1 Tax=Paenibacillus ferrarius TaxID=1469647 RepID=A0A1V4HHQ7_9BACL|nr:S-layer homology domain-containing protein [Paenibacillus ferrarius]OPH54642.1 hypothetical protein BC351_30965 [Paenibacillus ferrarius]
MIARQITRKVLSIVLMMCLMFTSIGVVNGQTIYSDIEGHWAEKQLRSWISQDLIKGYTDGSLKPNNEITRGEFMVLVNRLFQFNTTTSISFIDLIESNWEYVDVQKAVKVGYIQGYEDQTIRSSELLSRQEAAVIIAHLLNLANDENAANVFKDALTMAFWSKGAIGAIVSKNIIAGYEDYTFKPQANITRAEAVVMLDNAKTLMAEKTPTDIKVTPEPKPIPVPVPVSTSDQSGNGNDGHESSSPSHPITTGVIGTASTTTAGAITTMGVAQVATLPISLGATAAGTIHVTFTDGTTPVAVYVSLAGTESAANVAAKIVSAFGTMITGWNVTVSGANVLFTANAPAANNTNVSVHIESVGIGVGTPSSTITTPGTAALTGIAQVATLAISNGATAAGWIVAKFNDGTRPPVSVDVSIAGTETAADVAMGIAAAFGTSLNGWNVTANGTNVHFTAQTPAINNTSVAISVLEASGVGAPNSTITTPGNLGTNTAQVVTLTLPGSEASGGPIGVKFTDGVTSVSVNVLMLDFPETGTQLAVKIAAAFGNSIPGWNVSTDSTRVLFTANFPAANNTKAAARLSGAATGIGMPDSTITTAGSVSTGGIAQVATLAIANGTTAAGTIMAKFTDGTTSVSANVYTAGMDSASAVAAGIAAAFSTSITGWNVTANGTNVHFTAQIPATNNMDVAATVEEVLTGVGTPSSAITTAGVETTAGVAQVATLIISKGATAAGTLRVTFTDGITPVSVDISLTGTETATSVATKIAQIFGTSITGWNVAASDANVLFTANAPAANNTNVSVTIQ